MVKKTKGKHRLDKFYHLAKEQGYRSRAAFKLIQLNRKYNFLSNCRALLDLCAAPGGWLQVAAKNMPLSSLIIGVDLAPIKPIRGCKTMVADITTQKCRQMIKKEAASSMFDVVCHDGAPNVGGAWASEAYTQSALALDALKLATEFLSPKGTFVTKVFRSQDYNALLYALGQLFDKVEATKPEASRNASAEIFVVCLGYKAPAKIDPRLLDPKHLFQEVNEAPKIMGPQALLKLKIKQKRHRDGYADGVSTSHAVTSAAAFILSESPIEMLGQFTKFQLEAPGAATPSTGVTPADSPPVAEISAAIRQHPSTTSEIRALCDDLQVLGRSEFKQLLKWRLDIKKTLKQQLEGEKKSQKQAGADATNSGEELDPEEKLLQEMSGIKEAMDHRLKKERKKRREMKKKAKVRAVQAVASEGIGEDASGAPDDEQLFGLGVLPGPMSGRALSRMTDTTAPGEDDLALLDADSDADEDDDHGRGDEDSDVSADSEEERLAYEAQLEEALEDSYQQYLQRQGVRQAAQQEKRQRLGKGGELDEEKVGGDQGDSGSEDGASDDDGDLGLARGDGGDGHEDDDDDDEHGGRGGGLLVELDAARAGVAKSGAAVANQWFKQDLFNDPNVMDDSDDDDDDADVDDDITTRPTKRAKSDLPAVAGVAAVRRAAVPMAATAVPTGSDEAEHEDAVAGTSDADSDEDMLPGQRSKQPGQCQRHRVTGSGDGFEIVARSQGGAGSSGSGSDSDADSDADEFDALDAHGKAEVLALAKRMLRRKDKESILDAAYNRYAFHDDHLPRWFAEDEKRHMRPIPQVTKEEVAEEREALKAIDARPIKKVAEAKARKRKRMQVKLEAARAKATSVAAQEDVPMASRMREIQKLYAKARAAGKGRGGKGGKDSKRRGPPLDKRMLADKRGQDKRGRKGGSKGKGRGGKAMRGGKAGGSRGKGGRGGR